MNNPVEREHWQNIYQQTKREARDMIIEEMKQQQESELAKQIKENDNNFKWKEINSDGRR